MALVDLSRAVTTSGWSAFRWDLPDEEDIARAKERPPCHDDSVACVVSSPSSTSEDDDDDLGDPSIRYQSIDTVWADRITSVSLVLHWLRLKQSFTPILSYRVSVDDVEAGTGFQVYEADTRNLDTSMTIVNLRPGKPYRFHVAGLGETDLVVPGTAQRSPVVYTCSSTYERACYFEGDEEVMSSWSLYLEDRSNSRPMLSQEIAQDEVLQFRVWRTRERCFTGLSSLKFEKRLFHQAGVFTDFSTRPRRQYRVSVYIYQPDKTARPGICLAVWDPGARYEATEYSTKTGFWQKLHMDFAGVSSKTRFFICLHEEFQGEAYVDAVELVDLEKPSEMDALAEAINAPRLKECVRISLTDVVIPRGPADSTAEKLLTTCACQLYWNGSLVDTVSVSGGTTAEVLRSGPAAVCRPKRNRANGLVVRVYDTTVIKDKKPHREIPFADRGNDAVELARGILPCRREPAPTDVGTDAVTSSYVPLRGEMRFRLADLEKHPAVKIYHHVLEAEGAPSGGKIGMMVSFYEPKARTHVGRLLETVTAPHSAGSVTSYDRRMALEDLSRFVCPGDPTIALRAKVDMVTEGAVADIIARVTTEVELYEVICKILHGFLAVFGTDRSSAVIRLMLQKYVHALGLAHALHSYIEACGSSSMHECTLDVMYAMYDGNKSAVTRDMGALPGLFEAVKRSAQDSETARKLWLVLTTCKEAPPQVLDTIKRYHLDANLPLQPDEWEAWRARVESEAAQLHAVSEPVVEELGESCCSGISKSATCDAKWRFLVEFVRQNLSGHPMAGIDNSLFDVKGAAPLDEDPLTAAKGRAARVECLRRCAILFVVYILPVTLLSAMAFTGFVYAVHPKIRRHCRVPIIAFLNGDAWTLLTSWYILFKLQTSVGERRLVMVPRCLRLLSVLLVLHVMFASVGFFSVATAHRHKCRHDVTKTGRFYISVIIIGTLIVTVFGCCRRKRGVAVLTAGHEVTTQHQRRRTGKVHPRETTSCQPTHEHDIEANVVEAKSNSP